MGKIAPVLLVFAGAWDLGAISWWENVDDTGGEWGEHILSGSFEDASCVRAYGLNGNGTPDPLGTAYAGEGGLHRNRLVIN